MLPKRITLTTMGILAILVVGFTMAWQVAPALAGITPTPVPPTATAIPPTTTGITPTAVPPTATDTAIPPSETPTRIPHTPTPELPFVVVRIFASQGDLGTQLAAEAAKAEALGLKPFLELEAQW